MSTNSLPLDGITVVSFEHAIAAPLCTRQLADLGARVIKIERRETGDFARHYDQRANGLSSHFVWTNRGKQSLTLDIKNSAAREILLRLIAECDVLVENLAPGAMHRCGMSYDLLKDKFNHLVYCSISGYGNDGPYASRKAYDLMVQAESGLLSITGAEEVAKSGISIADISAGTQAHAAILSALFRKLREGCGSYIEISMLEAMVEWMGYPLFYSYEGQTPPPRTGADHASIYPYGAFRCKDDTCILLGIQNEREWTTFCTAILGNPGLATDPRFAENRLRSENRGALRQTIQDKLEQLPEQEVGNALDAAGIAWARVNELQQVWEHPQLMARERFASFATEKGPVTGTLPPSSAKSDSLGPVPALGEHTRQILSELHYTEQEIDELIRNKVV
jgi:itaconate CoA-transferase